MLGRLPNINKNDGHATRYLASRITPDLLHLAGVNPLMGRLLLPADDLPDAEKVVLLGYSIWQSYFAGDADIVGQRVTINEEVHTIVGVMPEGFRFPVADDLWVPNQFQPNLPPEDDGRRVLILGKYKAGQGFAAMTKDLQYHVAQLRADYPSLYEDSSALLWPMEQFFNARNQGVVRLMIGAALFVLILTCLNVGALLLARTTERYKEMALRGALGAPPFRLARQTLIESALIGFVGGVMGLVMAAWGLSYTKRFYLWLEFYQPYWWDFSLQPESYLLALVSGVLVWLLTAALPVYRGTRLGLSATLKQEKTAEQMRVSRYLPIGLQITLSGMLLVVAGVMMHSIFVATRIDFGVETEGYLTARVGLPASSYPDTAARVVYYDQVRSEVAAISGVNKVTLSRDLPGRASSRFGYNLLDTDLKRDGHYPRQAVINIADNYFDTMGVKLVSGRAFNATDTEASRPVIIIDEQFAERTWPGESPLQKQIVLRPGEPQERRYTVVGVVPHLVHGGSFGEGPDQTAFFIPLSQVGMRFFYLIAKVEGEPENYIEPFQQAASRANAKVPLYWLYSLENVLARRTATLAFAANNFVICALASLFMVAAGVYGLVSRTVALKTHEIGIKRALGATRLRVVSEYLRRTFYILLICIPVGAILGVMASNSAAERYGDLLQYLPLVLSVIVVLISLLTLLATFIPALKATGKSPAMALRQG